MKHTKLVGRAMLLLCVLALLLSTTALAAEVKTDNLSVYCFSGSEFAAAADTELQGVYVSSVPDNGLGVVRYGSRTIRAGDVLPYEALQLLTLTPAAEAQGEAELQYYPIGAEGLGSAASLKFSILSGQNAAPTAADSAFETYKNIANTGALKVEDPDSDSFTYTLIKEPKRGAVTLNDDGTFTYTPTENKVGKDSFVFTATDAAGNVSNEAKVSIKILKPTDKAMYADMSGDNDEYIAMWLKEEGIYAGQSIAGTLCFCPDGAVTRGEFLVMAMKLLGAEPEDAALTSGFADEADTPTWMRPYIVSALKNGMIAGVNSEEGMVFRPMTQLTKTEAAVMLQNILQLPQSETQSVFQDQSTEDLLPTWAEESVSALSEAGIRLHIESSADAISRREVACLLYDVYQLQQDNALSTFYWSE